VSPDPAPPGSTGLVAPGAWPPGFGRGRADRDALLVLAHLEGLTPAERHALAWREGSASACVRAVARGRVPGASSRDRTVAADLDPAEVRSGLARCGALVAAPGDDGYPLPLLDLPDPPVCLFVRGRRLVPWPAAVAVVGARLCSPYGIEVAEWLAGELAASGLAVVSGAALGIDAAAHRGALKASGTTVAVLGSGIDVPHPRTNRRLIERVASEGAVLSEYPPGVPALPHRFPARNRLVAALARGVLVVEGAPGSGSLITAEFAGDLGRDVLAVPGAITGPLSAAPHALIRDGAALVRGPEDVLEVLGYGPPPLGSDPVEANGPTDSAGGALGLSDVERTVLERLAGTPATLDAVVASTGIPPSRALRALASLELNGLVRTTGGRYRRTTDPAR